MYGKGIYGTRYADYVYSSQEEQVMVVSWTIVGNTYPVTEDPFSEVSLRYGDMWFSVLRK